MLGDRQIYRRGLWGEPRLQLALGGEVMRWLLNAGAALADRKSECSKAGDWML